MKSIFTSILFIAFIVTGSVSHAITWKGIFIAGDDSIENFDNGREDLTKQFELMGSLNSTQLSSSDDYISQKDGVLPADAENIINAFEQLSVKSGEGCLIHMTSHGVPNAGFYLSKAGPGVLPPDVFADLVNVACGDAPTVVLISACYSGQFITDALKGPNRVIMTAARSDRPSFGCSEDTEYTYWDGCMLENLPKSNTWTDLYSNVNACITTKESAMGFQPSEPQAFFGENTAEWTILD